MASCSKLKGQHSIVCINVTVSAPALRRTDIACAQPEPALRTTRHMLNVVLRAKLSGHWRKETHASNNGQAAVSMPTWCAQASAGTFFAPKTARNAAAFACAAARALSSADGPGGPLLPSPGGVRGWGGGRE